MLYLHPNGRLDAYDAIQPGPIKLTFAADTRHSRRDRERIRSIVERKQIAAIDDAGLPRAEQPDPCAVRAHLELLDIELYNPPSRATSVTQIVDSWGAVTLAQTVVDSETGAPLLHYRVRRSMSGSAHGGGRDWGRIRQTLDSLLDDMWLAVETMIPLSDSPPQKAGCKGDFHRYRARAAGPATR